MKATLPLYASAVSAGILTAVFARPEGSFQALLYPFQALGRALRALSLGSPAGNACAFAIYIALSLLPAGCFAWMRHKRKQRMDFLWLVLSAYGFALLYWLINPQALSALFPYTTQDTIPVLQGVVLFFGASLLIACVIFRWAGAGETRALFRQLVLLVGLVEWLMLFSIPAFGFAALTTDWGNAANGARLGLAIQGVASAVPQIFIVLMLRSARALLGNMRSGWFDAQNIELADRLARAARAALYAALWCMLASGGLELALARVIPNVNVQANIPLMELAGALTAMILACYVSASCAVKRENDLMI